MKNKLNLIPQQTSYFLLGAVFTDRYENAGVESVALDLDIVGGQVLKYSNEMPASLLADAVAGYEDVIPITEEEYEYLVREGVSCEEIV